MIRMCNKTKLKVSSLRTRLRVASVISINAFSLNNIYSVRGRPFDILGGGGGGLGYFPKKIPVSGFERKK